MGTNTQPPQGPKTATNPTSKKTYTLRHTNCVYLIKCTRCGILYVGETRNTLTLEPPEVFVYLKPPPGQIDPLLECIDFQGKMLFY